MERINEMNEVMSIVGKICGENVRAKEARLIARKVEMQDKERKKQGGSSSIIGAREAFNFASYNCT